MLAKQIAVTLGLVIAATIAPFATIQAQEANMTSDQVQSVKQKAIDCFDAAATHHRVNPWVLRAIAKHESGGKAQARGFNHPSNGISLSVSEDWGMMQINTNHLPKLKAFGVTPEQLWDGCTNVFVGAWILRESMNTHGNTWTAIGAYNSPLQWRRAWYAGKIKAILDQWNKQGLMPSAPI